MSRGFSEGILVLDCEIKKMVPTAGEDRILNAQYCDGWGDKAGMGISVCCVRMCWDDTSRVFLDDNRADLAELATQSYGLVTFDGINFDLPLIEACWGIDLSGLVQIDLKEMVARALELDPRQYQRGYSLDGLLAANGLPSKPGDSILAPLQWQLGEIGRVIDKCLGDVDRTAQLFELALLNPLKDPNGGDDIDLRPMLDAAMDRIDNKSIDGGVS